MLGQAIVAASRHAAGRRVDVGQHDHVAGGRCASASPVRVGGAQLRAARSPPCRSRYCQGERLCAAGTLLLDSPSADVIRHAAAAPDVPGPYECPPYDMGVTGRDIRVVDGAYSNDPDEPSGPPTLDAWVRFRHVPDDPALHAGLLAQFTGHMSIAAALRPHEGVSQDQAHHTLSMAINSISLSSLRSGQGRRLVALPPSLDVRRCRDDPRREPGVRPRRCPGGLLLRRCHGAAAPQRSEGSDGRTDGAVSLTTGRGPLSGKPAGRFTAAMPEKVSYMEPFRRRVTATKDGRTVVESERALLLHRPGQPPALAFPAGDVDGVPTADSAEAPGFVTVAWDAVDAWFEEDEQMFGHVRNPYHRVDSLRSHRLLRVEAAGVTLVDTTETMVVYETALEPRLYVHPEHVHGPTDRERNAHLLPLQGHCDVLERRGRRSRAGGRCVELRRPVARVGAAAAPAELRRPEGVRRPRPAGRRLTHPIGARETPSLVWCSGRPGSIREWGAQGKKGGFAWSSRHCCTRRMTASPSSP